VAWRRCHWAGAVYPYVKAVGVFHWPDDPRQNSALPKYVCSYAMNGNLRGQLQANLASPTWVVLETEFDGNPLSNFTQPERASPYTWGATTNRVWGSVRLGVSSARRPTRHDPYVMFLAADGHVKLLRPETVSSGLDNPSATGAQDATHAAGGGTLAASSSKYTLTFSER